jgi:REP element-mobilizing transposase RayT
MAESLHVLSVHIVFSTKERQRWLNRDILPRVWAYQSRILQNLECYSVTIGGVEDHVHIACNLTKKTAPMKVLEILKKDSSKFVKTLSPDLAAFHWQEGYGLFSVSPSHVEGLREYILNQQEHHKTESFQDEYLRLLKKYNVSYDPRYLACPSRAKSLMGNRVRWRCHRLLWRSPSGWFKFGHFAGVNIPARSG